MMEDLILIMVGGAGLFAAAFIPRIAIPLVLIYSVIPIRTWTEYSITLPVFGNTLLDTVLASALVGIMAFRILIARKLFLRACKAINLTFIFVGAAFVSAVIVGMTGEASGFRMLLRLAFPMLVLAVVLVDHSGKEDGDKLVRFFLFVGVLTLGGVAIANLAGVSSWRWSAGVDRFAGLGSISDYAYLMGAMTMISYVRLRVITGHRILNGMLMLIFGSLLLMTVTRGAIFATMASLVVIEQFGLRQRFAARLNMLVISILVGTAIIVLYKPLGDRIFASNYKDVAQSSASTSDKLQTSFSRSGRESLWSYVFEKVIFTPHIVYGYGVGKAEVEVVHDLGAVPHNEYVRVLYEMGVPGVVLFVLAYIQIWRLLRKCLASPDAAQARVVSLACLGFLVLFMAGALVDNMLNKYKNMGAPLFMLVGAVLPVARQGRIAGRLSDASDIDQDTVTMLQDGDS